LVLLQVIWCCRQNKIGLYISAGISFVAAITCTVAGIVMIIVWKDNVYCQIWGLTDGYDGNDYYSPDNGYPEKPDYCKEGIWAAVAFLTALLWFATSGCILYFVKSGRHTKWEEKLQATADAVTTPTTTTAIEMGNVQHHHHHDDNDHRQQEQEQQSPIAVATTSATTVATSYVLPDIPDNKIDDAS